MKLRGTWIELVLVFTLGIAIYLAAWIGFREVSSPVAMSTRLIPAIPAGLVFLHFFVRWCSPERKPE